MPAYVVACPRIRERYAPASLVVMRAGDMRDTRISSNTSRHQMSVFHAHGETWRKAVVLLCTQAQGAEDQRGRTISKLDCKRTAQAPPRLASDRICGGGAGVSVVRSLHCSATSRRLPRWGASEE